MKLFVVLIIAELAYRCSASLKDDIRDCDANPPTYPTTTVRTADRVSKLRDEMRKENIAAYIIPSTDAHGSEYVQERDKRRQFICGFSGTAGTAIVTMNQSAFWTDGRYFIQAEMQLECQWILQRYRVKGFPSQAEWLIQVLKSGDVVGIDPFLINTVAWDSMVKQLAKGNITLKGITKNLVDEIWSDRPPPEPKKVHVQNYTYTGKHWWEKVQDVQKKMKEVKATVHVVQALDSVAWLLNLRGDEVLYNPVFFAYVVVTQHQVLFFVDKAKLAPQAVKTHLKLDTCKAGESYCITRKDYGEIKTDLEKLSLNRTAKIWLSPLDSQALRLDVRPEKIYLQYSPIVLMKGIKNEVELKGMRNVNLKDSVALAEFFLWTEKQVAAKAKDLTELKLYQKMEEFRSKQALYKGLSFPSIIGFGPNSAIIHYTASNETNKLVTDQSTLLVDTGSQYSDGTTDVTRTVHFGKPTATQKSAFTRVLIGHIDLATPVFPEGTYGRELDIFAREALYKNGWDYQHGTGHGIGSYLFIHEGPGAFGKVTRPFPIAKEAPLHVGFVITDEPGFYVPGDFGIRIETTLVVVNASTPNRFNNVDYLTFEPICYFPIQRSLIDKSLMTQRQIEWLNNYHKKTRELVGKELKRQGKTEAYEWLLRETKPIETGSPAGAAATLTWSISLAISIFIAIQFGLCIS